MMKNSHISEGLGTMDRRSFLKGAALAAGAFTIGGLGAIDDLAFAQNGEISARYKPYITAITPEMIADNDKGWVYYGAEANDRPLRPWDKGQMADEDFDENVITLKCSCYYPNSGDIGHGIHWETFNFLEHQLGGRVQFDRYFGQALHKLRDGWKALRSGVIDVGQIYHIHHPDHFNLFHADGLPFLSNNVVAATQIMEEMYPKYFKGEVEKQGVHLAWIPHFDVQGLICKTPIRKMEDLQGKRIMGFGGAVMRDTLAALGATPVEIHTPDVYLALARGKVDGVAWGVGSMMPWRLHEIAKYVTVTGMSNTAISYGINKKTFARLPKDLRKELYYQFRRAGNHMSEGYTKLEDRGFDGLKRAGVEIIIPDAREKARWVAAGQEVWEKFQDDNRQKGLPVDDFARDIRAAAEKYNKMSIRQIREYVADRKNTIPGIIDGLA